MAATTWDPSVSRIKEVAERDGVLSYPDMVNLIRSTLDHGGISIQERKNLQVLASRTRSHPAKKLIENLVAALSRNDMLGGQLTMSAFAANRICDFLMGSDPGRFPKLDRDEIAVGLMMRISNPGLIDQGRSSLCGPASLLFALASRDPLEYVNFAIELFEKGRAKIGTMEIKPGRDCRNYRPPAGSIAHVDWLTAASIRDSENWFLDYDSVGDQLAGITLPGELAEWFKKAGFDDVQDDSETWRLFTKAPASLIEKANDLFNKGYRICLLINDHLMYKSSQSEGSMIAKHWVVLTSPIERSPSLKFTVFSWGKGSYKIPHPAWNATAGSYSGATSPLSESDLREHLFGVVSAKP